MCVWPRLWLAHYTVKNYNNGNLCKGILFLTFQKHLIYLWMRLGQAWRAKDPPMANHSSQPKKYWSFYSFWPGILSTGSKTMLMTLDMEQSSAQSELASMCSLTSLLETTSSFLLKSRPGMSQSYSIRPLGSPKWFGPHLVNCYLKID